MSFEPVLASIYSVCYLVVQSKCQCGKHAHWRLGDVTICSYSATEKSVLTHELSFLHVQRLIFSALDLGNSSFHTFVPFFRLIMEYENFYLLFF